jgi:hypothetical protein
MIPGKGRCLGSLSVGIYKLYQIKRDAVSQAKKEYEIL